MWISLSLLLLLSLSLLLLLLFLLSSLALLLLLLFGGIIFISECGGQKCNLFGPLFFPLRMDNVARSAGSPFQIWYRDNVIFSVPIKSSKTSLPFYCHWWQLTELKQINLDYSTIALHCNILRRMPESPSYLLYLLYSMHFGRYRGIFGNKSLHSLFLYEKFWLFSLP